LARKPKQRSAIASVPVPSVGSEGIVHPRAWVAALLGALGLAIALVAASLQPWDPGASGCQRRTPPDEIAHALYIQDLLRDRRLPLLTSGAGNYEAHQPPLYYVLAMPAAGLSARLVSGADLDDGRLGVTICTVRLFSCLLAGGVVVACYLVGTAVFPRSRPLQVSTAAFSALLPGHIISLAAVTNDGLAELLCCLVLWQCIVLVRWRREGLGRYVALGVLIGAALLTKTSAMFLLPVAVFALALSHAPSGAWRAFAARAGLMLGVAAVLWAPWIAHNLAHYPGDPLVTRTFVELFGKDRPGPGIFLAAGLSWGGYARLVATWTYCSFWGVLGEASVFMPSSYYLLGTALPVVCAVGWVAGLARWKHAPAESRAVWSILLAAGILVAAQFARFQVDFFQAQARYLFPAIAPIACAFVAGLERFVRLCADSRWAGRAVAIAFAVAGASLGILLIAALVTLGERGWVGPAPPWIGLPR
jgi:4-amino-4-deoxy-L-arabinose transferase-like glycosyltransferase